MAQGGGCTGRPCVHRRRQGPYLNHRGSGARPTAAPEQCGGGLGRRARGGALSGQFTQAARAVAAPDTELPWDPEHAFPSLGIWERTRPHHLRDRTEAWRRQRSQEWADRSGSKEAQVP